MGSPSGDTVRRSALILVLCAASLSCSSGGDAIGSPNASAPPDSAAGPTAHMPPLHQGVIHGTKAADVLYGTESGERIEGLAGADTIIARGGDDVLDGGLDSDLLIGGFGDDTYVLGHHGGGADIIVEEGGTDTLQLAYGRITLASIEVLRHGDDLLVRWNHDSPLDIVMIRSWFASTHNHVERLALTDGTVVSLESLAARARPATSEDFIHFAAPRAVPEGASPN